MTEDETRIVTAGELRDFAEELYGLLGRRPGDYEFDPESQHDEFERYVRIRQEKGKKVRT